MSTNTPLAPTAYTALLDVIKVRDLKPQRRPRHVSGYGWECLTLHQDEGEGDDYLTRRSYETTPDDDAGSSWLFTVQADYQRGVYCTIRYSATTPTGTIYSSHPPKGIGEIKWNERWLAALPALLLNLAAANCPNNDECHHCRCDHAHVLVKHTYPQLASLRPPTSNGAAHIHGTAERAGTHASFMRELALYHLLRHSPPLFARPLADWLAAQTETDFWLESESLLQLAEAEGEQGWERVQKLKFWHQPKGD